MKRALLTVAIALLLAPLPVSAQRQTERSARPDIQRTAQPDKRQEKERLTEEKCQRIGQRLDERLTKLTEREGKHVERYQRQQQRVKTIVDKLAAEGFDVTQLRTDEQALVAKITQLKADFDAYLGKLRESKNFTCGHSEGEFKARLQEARALHARVKADAKDIREYFKNTIRADIRALRKAASPAPSPVVGSQR